MVYDIERSFKKVKRRTRNNRKKHRVSSGNNLPFIGKDSLHGGIRHYKDLTLQFARST